MKKRRFLVALMTMVIMASGVLALSASAQNGYTDTYFYDFKINVHDFDSYLDFRDKYNTSSVYMYIERSTNTSVATNVRIDAAKAQADGSLALNTDLTLSRGKLAYYVTCSQGIQYNIHTLIYENGYRICRPAFRSGAMEYAYITGRWSPDCLGTYTDATGLEK